MGFDKALELNLKGVRSWGSFLSGGPLGSVDLVIVVARWLAKMVGLMLRLSFNETLFVGTILY